MGSWVVFLDLVKAFNTVNHELILKLLAKYGVPANVIRVIKKLYTNFNLKLKIGDITEIIPYLTGVKQGDALAPTLFLFIMQAMAENVLNIWKKEEITPFTHLYDHVNGKMVRHKPLKKNKYLLQPVHSVLHLILILYVNDGALCSTR